MDIASSDASERVSGDDGQPFLSRTTFDWPEAECDGEEREDERRDDARSAGERAHQDYAYGEACCDDEYLRRTQRSDETTALERPEAIPPMFARAHALPPSRGGRRSERNSGWGGESDGGVGGAAERGGGASALLGESPCVCVDG